MLNRRETFRHLFAAGSAVYAAGWMASATAADSTPTADAHVPVALNTSTIRGHNLPLDRQVEVAIAAGYDGIEPWIRDVRAFEKDGGSVDDLAARMKDANLSVVSAIGFANWISEDAAQRKAGLEEAAADMRLVRRLGGRHIAAPPIGAHKPDMPRPSIEDIGDRYRALCEVGQAEGVFPQLELWGFSPTLSKLEEMAYVGAAASHSQACFLPDFYHIYKGGNDFESLRMLEASAMHCFHINDYPGEPTIAEIADKDRVYPGDGVCPLPKLIRMLLDNGFRGTFSLELFNPDYWKRPVEEVARVGLEKTRAVIELAKSA